MKKCDMCNSKDATRIFKKQEDWLKEYGFYVHFVIDADPPNIHTHGLVQTMNHLDLQIAYPLDSKLLMTLINDMVAKIKEGARIKDGDILDYVFEGHNVKAIQMTEMGRAVIRILLPDAKGKFPDEEDCEEKYKIQIKKEEL